jgi:hypothetical protein
VDTSLQPHRISFLARTSLFGTRDFPFRPLWPGFAINTLFYAAILWLLFAAPFVLRRWRRVRRGLCPACGYPVGTSPVCTECGAELKTHKRTNAESGDGVRNRLQLRPNGARECSHG